MSEKKRKDSLAEERTSASKTEIESDVYNYCYRCDRVLVEGKLYCII